MPNNIRAIKFLNWYFLRISLDDLDFTKPLKWEGGSQGSGAVQIAVDGTTTVEGYSVPSPTAEELTAIYNAVVAGNNVQIVDSNDVYYQVLQADSVDNSINVEILYFSEMSLLYTLENETVSITSKKIGGATYTAGNGISIDTNNEISVTDHVVMNKARTTQYGAIALGQASEVNTSGIIIGAKATGNTYTGQIVIGEKSGATKGFGVAIGYNAHSTADGAIQLSGAGNSYDSAATNSERYTFKVCLGVNPDGSNNYKLLDSDGTIPADRLASTTGLADGNYRLRLVMASGVPSLEWVAE